MADTIEVYDGTGYVSLGEGPPGPTTFVRHSATAPSPRHVGDLWSSSKAEVDWSTDWIYPTLINGWVNYGAPFTPARYRRTAGRVVFIDGLIKSGTIATPAFVLPAGFRPAYRLITCAVDTGNKLPERMDVTNTGNVQPQSGSNGWFTLNTTFYADN